MRKSGTFFTIAAGAAIAGLLLAERHRPLRTPSKPTAPRTLTNIAMGASCAVIVAAVEEPLTQAIARKNLSKRRGIAQKFPAPVRLVTGIMAMDYGFYWWHVATHRIPVLWRFHRVHHVDSDMDVSTAIRFHAADMAVSLPWRLVQVRLSGVSPKALRWWRRFFNASILFHHSNWALPAGMDRKISAILTTPEMHGVHHSKEAEEQDSNFTSGLSMWDRLHGTYRGNERPHTIDIGVDDRKAERDNGLIAALRAPFRKNDI